MTKTSVITNYPWKNSGEKVKQMNLNTDELGLTELALKIAKNELREDKNARDECLKQMREWIEQNVDIENIRLDDRFLLRFLRVKKYSIPMAQQTLLKYLNLKNVFPHMCCKLDWLEPKQNEILNNGYIFASPIRDKLGRRVIIVCVENFNPKIYSSADQAKAHFIVYETLLDDPENQVTGTIHIGDFTNVSATHVTNWNPTEFARIVKWGEQSIPMRHKEFHSVNMPSSVKWILDFVKGRVSPKMKDRIYMHTNFNELHEQVDPSCLPKEMGGKMPMKEMIELWKHELEAKRDVILALDKMKLLSDRGIITRNHDGNNNPSQSEINSMTGSFRKLEFD